VKRTFRTISVFTRVRVFQAIFGNTVVYNLKLYATSDVKRVSERIMEGKRLYVGNLTYSVNETQLGELFSKYGEVESVKIIEQKGFGFVEMGSSEEAQAAMDALNETVFEGRNLRIDEARPMQPRREFSSGGSGGYGGNRRRY